MKRKIKNLLLITLAALLVSCSSTEKGEQSILRLSLIGKEYDKLELQIFTGDSTTTISGNKESNFEWSFTYPDSVYKKHYMMRFTVPSQRDAHIHTIPFYSLSNAGDTLKNGQFTISYGNQRLVGHFVRNTVQNVDFIENYPNGCDLEEDVFFVKEDTITDFSIGARSNNNINKYDTITYNTHVEKFVKLVRQYNDSHYLMFNLSNSLQHFNTKKDISYILSEFSEKQKESYYGKIVRDYLKKSISFEDIEGTIKLTNAKTDKKEFVLKNSDKYNLIVFSASWCAPCHEQLPLLKDIYKDLNKDLNIIYISIDENKTIKDWKDWIKKQEVPWDCYITENIKDLIAKFSIREIPYSLLVYPNGTIESIDPRQNVDKVKLYQNINNKTE